MTQLPQFKRDIELQIRARLTEKARFIQVMTGPRQVGKTTAVKQALQDLGLPSSYCVADLPAPPEPEWIEAQWKHARHKAREQGPVILVLDEVQKIERWSEVVKKLWDEDREHGLDLRVAVLGSSALLLQWGLVESLAGRFELLRCGHWTFKECRDCFGWDLDTFLYFGGYPGAAPLIAGQERWAEYVRNSLIETAISKDVLLMNRIEKPALLRKVFVLACEYAAEILTYQKMLGQLADAGNTTTLAGYGQLLMSAYLIAVLEKYSEKKIKRRASSPKWLPLNTALITAVSQKKFEELRGDPEAWGRLVEAAVGAYLFHECDKRGWGLFYWREGNQEVDYVVRKGSDLIALEVKSGKKKHRGSGLAVFQKRFRRVKSLVIGTPGIALVDFFTQDLSAFF